MRTFQRRGSLPCPQPSAVLAHGGIDDMELLVGVAEEQVSYDCRTQQQGHFQALVVLELDAVEIRLHDGQLPQARE